MLLFYPPKAIYSQPPGLQQHQNPHTPDHPKEKPKCTKRTITNAAKNKQEEKTTKISKNSTYYIIQKHLKKLT